MTVPVCIGHPLGVALRMARETYETAALPLSYVGADQELPMLTDISYTSSCKHSRHRAQRSWPSARTADNGRTRGRDPPREQNGRSTLSTALCRAVAGDGQSPARSPGQPGVVARAKAAQVGVDSKVRSSDDPEVRHHAHVFILALVAAHLSTRREPDDHRASSGPPASLINHRSHGRR